MLMYITFGIATAFNILIVKHKVENARYVDAVYDIFALVILTAIFGGTFGGLVTAMVASTIVSLYLLRFPPKIPRWNVKEKRIEWK